MISILIPIYNELVVELVRALHRQSSGLGIAFEIICLDDHSLPQYRKKNKSLDTLSNVRYLELPANVGRARIRNRLADMAAYPYLLFMDGDSRVVRPDYIETYLQALHPAKVIYGGRVYQSTPPADGDLYLHWHYGRRREAIAVVRRNEHPYRSFMSNNFILPKAIFERVQFDESIHRYGYEDTLYALALQRLGIEILHLDNPLEHAGLEKRTNFLRKMLDALDNLRELLPRYPELSTRLLDLAGLLKRWRLAWLVRRCAPVLMPVSEQILRHRKAPLWILDLYKLCYFLRPKREM